MNYVDLYKISCIFFFFQYALSSQAQNPTSTTLTWKSVSAVNQIDNSSFSYACSFVTYGNKKLDWVQRNGDKVSHFNVSSVDGQWVDLSRNGQLIYHVSDGDLTGTLTFSKNSGGYSVHLKLYIARKLDQDYLFSISNVSTAP